MKWRCCGNTSTNMLRFNRQKIESDHGEKKAVMNLKRSHVKMNLNARHLDANFDVTRACVNTSITNLCLLFFFLHIHALRSTNKICGTEHVHMWAKCFARVRKMQKKIDILRNMKIECVRTCRIRFAHFVLFFPQFIYTFSWEQIFAYAIVRPWIITFKSELH